MIGYDSLTSFGSGNLLKFNTICSASHLRPEGEMGHLPTDFGNILFNVLIIF